jgi:hypothetical protein
MATSGSTDFSANGESIVTEALEQLGVLAEGQYPNSNQFASCSRTLNMMLKSWQASPGGTNLFALQKVYLFLQRNQTSYELSSTGDHFTNDFVQTSTNAQAISGASSIFVDDTSGINDGNYIGVKLESGLMHWTTVVGTPTNGEVSLAEPLTEDSLDTSIVYSYATKAKVPEEVMEAARRNANSNVDTPLDKMTLRDYTELTTKNSRSSVLQYYYEKQKNYATLKVWPTTSRAEDYLVLWIRRPLHDIDTTTDEVDYPQSWFMAVALGLSVLLAPKYGVSSGDFQKLTYLAQLYKDMAESGDTELSIRLQPETRY